MGCWDVFCSLCALPLNSCSTKCKMWMSKCSILLNNNKIVHNTKEIACNINFYDKKKKNYYTSLIYFPKSFIVIHTDCWKYCKKELGISLKYSDFPLHNISPNVFFVINGINYKPISNYWDQYFEAEEYLKKGYSFDPPAKNIFLSKFIKNTILQLKIKKDRIGPSISATFYKNNDLLIGNDNKIWKINKKKWVKVTDITEKKEFIKIPVTKKNQILLENICNYFSYSYFESSSRIIKKIAKLPQLGEVSNIGIIIRDVKCQIAYKYFTMELMVLYSSNSNPPNITQYFIEGKF